MTIAVEHIRMAKALAAQHARTSGRTDILDELTSVAFVGLVQAAIAFDPQVGVKFTTFAWHRIRGAILDFVRAECAGGRFVKPEKLQRLRERFRRRLGNDRMESTQEHYVELRLLDKRMDQLKPVQRDLVERVALGETLEAVGAEHGITKSWACRLYNSALEALAA